MPKLNVVFIPVEGPIRVGEIEFQFNDNMRMIIERAKAAGLSSRKWSDKRVYFDGEPVLPQTNTMSAVVVKDGSTMTIVEDEEARITKW